MNLAMLKRVTILIPLTFNDGTAVPEAALNAMEEEVYLAFNGWTVLGEVAGAYRMQHTGAKKVDRLLHVWVVVEEQALPELRRMVARFGALLGQEAMYFEVAESEIELLPPPTGEDPVHE